MSIGHGPISEAEPVRVVEEVSMGPALRDPLRWLDTVDLTCDHFPDFLLR